MFTLGSSFTCVRIPQVLYMEFSRIVCVSLFSYQGSLSLRQLNQFTISYWICQQIFLDFHKKIYKDIILVNEIQKHIFFNKFQTFFSDFRTAQYGQYQKGDPDKKYSLRQTHQSPCQLIYLFDQRKAVNKIQNKHSDPDDHRRKKIRNQK